MMKLSFIAWEKPDGKTNKHTLLEILAIKKTITLYMLEQL